MSARLKGHLLFPLLAACAPADAMAPESHRVGASVEAGTWSATGGTITQDGVYTAGATPGTYRVVYSEGGKAATAEVTIVQSAPPPPPTGGCGAPPVCAFPGAVGFGSQTAAGRGGAILRVTNLNNTGTGSLRAALTASGPRTIVFEVSGTIVLTSDLMINNPFVTIAGQTAPSPGITVRNGSFLVQTHDVLVQHIRLRVGPDAPGGDGFRLYGGTSSDVYNVIVDHVSTSWATDEVCGTSAGAVRRDITISNSIVSEGLMTGGDPNDSHSKGCSFGHDNQRIALIGSILAHNRDRNPRTKANTSGVVVNNVIYNWGSGGANATYMDGSDGTAPSSHAVVGNSYLKGVNSGTGNSNRPIRIASSVATGTRIYVADNRIQRASPPSDPWALVENSFGSSVKASSAPVWPAGFTAISSSQTEAYVLAHAGARPADRDAVDARIVDEVRTLTGSLIDSPSQRGGWPVLAQNTRAFVAPANPNGDDDGDGYTNLEEVLHQHSAAVE